MVDAGIERSPHPGANVRFASIRLSAYFHSGPPAIAWVRPKGMRDGCPEEATRIRPAGADDDDRRRQRGPARPDAALVLAGQTRGIDPGRGGVDLRAGSGQPGAGTAAGRDGGRIPVPGAGRVHARGVQALLALLRLVLAGSPTLTCRAGSQLDGPVPRQAARSRCIGKPSNRAASST